MDRLIKGLKIENYLDKNKTIVIGVSAGVDSMSLLFNLHSLGYKLVVAHINHKRRVQSEEEFKFLEDYTKNINVPFEATAILKPLEGNFQQEARNFRYDFYKKVALKYHTDIIVTAHNLDDEAETILMRQIRGTSLRGYHGMDVISYDGDFKVVRPLLYTTKEEIKAYNQSKNIPYYEDESNSEDHYTRNIIRHNIIPKMKEINPDFLSAMMRYSSDQKEVFNLVESLTVSFYNKFVIIKDNVVSVSINELIKESLIVQKNIVLKAINLVSKNTVLATHERIEKILGLSSSVNQLIEIKKDLVCAKEYGNLVFYKKADVSSVLVVINGFEETSINAKTKIIISHNYHLLPNKNSYMLCYNDENDVFPLTVRTVKNGDKITVNGITKKVNDVLNEHKIAKRERNAVLLVENKNGVFFINNVLRKESPEGMNVMYITFEEKET